MPAMTSEASLAATVGALRRSSLFAACDEASLRGLCRRCAEEEAPGGQVLMRQGEAGSFACVLLAGEVEVSVETPLGASRVAVLGPGELIGEIASLADLPRSATVTSRAPVRMVRIDRSVLLDWVSGRPDFALAIIRALSLRLQGVHQPLSYFLHAVRALETDDIDPGLLEALTQRAGEITPFAESFARMLHALARRRSERHEMAIAGRLQRSMLPSEPPLLPGVRVDARMLPARIVGGDFYDWFLLPGGQFAFAVADVSGKGVPAAFLAGVTRTALRAAALGSEPSPDRILGRVNAILAEGNDELMFVSLFLGILDAREGCLEWANAGHPAALQLNSSGVAAMAATGPVLGIQPGARFTSERQTLTPGDRLFLYTDGISDALDEDGRFFGSERVEALALRLRDRDAASANDDLIAELLRFAGRAEQADDITCLTLDWRES